MTSLPPEDDAADEIDPEEYAELQQKIDEAHDQFLIKHLKRVWPRNALRLLGILQILLALAFVGVDLPIVLMFATALASVRRLLGLLLCAHRRRHDHSIE